MGNTFNTPKYNYKIINSNNLTNFKNVTIPDNFKLIKLVSYDICLENSLSIHKIVNDITQYLFTEFRGKTIDILCLQGIDDKVSVRDLIISIKKILKEKLIKMYFVPTFDDIDDELDSKIPTFISTASDPKSFLYKYTNSIIISKYPIISFGINRIKNPDDDTILNIIIHVNINICGSIITIYNVSLYNNYVNIGVDIKYHRKIELDTLMSIINNNDKEIINNTKKIYTDCKYKQLNFIVGTFHIEEKRFNIITYEYEKLINVYKCVDVYRYLNNDKVGFTTKTNKRIDYIMFTLSNDVYNNNKWSKILNKVKTDEQLFNFIFKKYGIHFIQTYINIDMDCRNHFPVENIFMLKIN